MLVGLTERQGRAAHRQMGLDPGRMRGAPLRHPGPGAWHPPERGDDRPGSGLPPRARRTPARRSHYELGMDPDPQHQLPAAYAEPALTI
ncbi:MAG: hypothetical protein ACRDRT_14020 [Pseudonocardiaceae bacterium]